MKRDSDGLIFGNEQLKNLSLLTELSQHAC